MNTIEWIGLIIFVLAWFITGGVLGFDWLGLAERGKETISAHLWQQPGLWWVEDLLILGIALQPIGFYIHIRGGQQ